MKSIIRTYSAGVFFGEVENHDLATGTATLKNSRRLWEWKVNGPGVGVGDVALLGIDQSRSNVGNLIPTQFVAEIIEIIPASDAAIKSIETAKVGKNG